MIGEVNLTFVWDVVSGIRSGREGWAWVADGRSRLIAHPDLSYMLSNFDASQQGHADVDHCRPAFHRRRTWRRCVLAEPSIACVPDAASTTSQPQVRSRPAVPCCTRSSSSTIRTRRLRNHPSAGPMRP